MEHRSGGAGHRTNWFRRLAVTLLVVGLIAGCTSSPSTGGATTALSTATTVVTQATNGTGTTATTNSTAPSTTTAAVTPPDVPQPPAPITLSGGAPADEAKAAADAVAEAGDAGLAGWLATYAAAGVPVVGASVAPDAADADRMGPYYWSVWMQVDDAHASKAIRLDELMQFLADQPGGDALKVGDDVLADLRADATGADPTAAFLADFVAERESRRAIPVSILDPAVTAAQVELDGATAQLLGWAVTRNVVAHLASSAPASGLLRKSSLSAMPLARRAGFQCNQLWGSEDATFWVNWFANQIGSSTGIAHLGAFPGLWNTISSFAPGLMSSSTASRATSAAAKINILTSMLTLLMQLKAIDVTGFDDPSPLDRTNLSSENAKTSTSYYKLSINPDSLPDGNKQALCGLSFLLNAMGISFSFPAGGNLTNVEVQVEPGEGFGQGLASGYVELPNQSDLKQNTNENGQISVLVRGVHQKHDIPTSNPRRDREYSVHITATPGEVNGNNIFNTFFDGLTASDLAGAAKGALDVAQTIHWDLGEQVSPLKDWVAGYAVDQTVAGAYHVTGQICDSSQPFNLNTDGNLGGALNVGKFVVEGSSWTFDGSTSAIGKTLLLDAAGSATITTDPDTGLHVNIGQGSWTVTAPIVGKMPYGPNGQHIGPFDLELTPLDECDHNS